ncbi:MAG: DUF2066 domain-containing protein [Alphaproteobacteria bacterium]|nr:DUF2066 domain-containing protein [Alphaproteobacteria bacterium]
MAILWESIMGLKYKYFAIFGLLLVCLANTPNRPVWAAGNLFEVKGIKVDATARSVTDARLKALAQGQRAGFATLLKRLTRDEDWAVLPDVATIAVEDFVLNFRVQNEKNTRRRYIATLSVQFDAALVSSMLRELNIPYAETQAKPALILPLLEDVTGYRLWDNHWWAENWAALDLANIPAPMVMALGDPGDMTALTVEDVLLGDTESLAALAARYNADAVIVAHALARDYGRLDVTIYQYTSAGSRLFVRNFKGKGEPREFGEQAVQTILDELSAEWKSTAVVSLSQQTTFTLAADYQRMNGWLTLLDRLESASFIKALEVHVLTSRGAIISLSYTGSVDQLAANLAQSDIILREDDMGWRIKLR